MANQINKMQFQPWTTPILTIVNDIKIIDKWWLDLQPTYQRWYIWKKDYQEKLIYSLFNHYPIWSIIIRTLDQPNEKKAKKEVVDWQQRLTTIYNFINNDFILENEIAKKIIEISKEYFDDESINNNKIKKILEKYISNKRITLKFSDLPERLKSTIYAINIATISITNASTEQVAEYFRFVQNQERLRAWEIIESFPDTVLEKYLLQLNNKDNLLKILNFSDDRKEFEKIFYWMIWIFDKKINLGSTDNIIKDYVSNKNLDLDWEALDLVNMMIINLNKISNTSLFNNQDIKCNKRMLKFIMLLSAFNLLNLETDKEIEISILKLNEINKKLSAFNSAKKEAIKENFGSEENWEKYRPMSLIVKWSHNFKKVKEVMESLWNIILKKIV